MKTKVSNEAEEYLEAIYKLQKRRGVARTTELARELNVVPGSVTNTLERLKKHGLVKRKLYRGITLTVKGEKLALKILRRHRLAERLLIDILDAEWSSVHENACKLEHALTNEVIALLEKKLGYPKFCPHGNPIPSENGNIAELKDCSPLTEARVDAVYAVVGIIDEKREKLQILAGKEIKPGVTVQVVEKKPLGIVLHVAGKKCTLNNDVASSILVKNIEDVKNARRKKARV